MLSTHTVQGLSLVLPNLLRHLLSVQDGPLRDMQKVYVEHGKPWPTPAEKHGVFT